jgi:hypothetical protein
MAFITTGLTDNGSGAGKTNHYSFSYDDALNSTTNPGKPEPARTNQMMTVCEADFNWMSNLFAGLDLPYSLPVSVQVANAGGGASWGPPITLKPDSQDFNFCRFLLVAEVVEMLMLKQNKGWFAPDGSNEQSSGEGLSRFLSAEFLFANGLSPNAAPYSGYLVSNSWMNSSRDDFVNNIDEYDHNPDAKSGCATLFLYYLFTQLGFSINQIVAAAAPTLSGVYRNLTGDAGDPFPFFKRMLDAAYPGTSTITTGSNLDNPYPVGLLSFWVNKSTFGRDEIQDAINGSGGRFPNAFYLIVEGFNVNTFNSLGVTVNSFAGAFKTFPGVSISRNSPSVVVEIPSNPTLPQRIRIGFDITFTQATLNAPQFPAASANLPLELDTSLLSGGQKLRGSDAATICELTGGEDPYFTNIDPTQNNVFYLSQDLRVFTATPGLNGVPVAGGPAFGSDTPSGAFTYVQNLLTFLNTNFGSPAGPDPFTTILPSQAGALTGDSSVSPFSFTVSGFPPQVRVFNNYNFAVARVRLRGTPGNSAPNVKTFFRLWSTETADTDYQIGSTYPSTPDSAGLPATPLVGLDHHTLPFFATGNFTGNTDYAAGGPNVRNIQLTGSDNVWAYFGCFLNLYDAGNIIDGSQIQRWLNGTHHCIVAQIAFDSAPIVNANGITATPESSDKLAQRNLQVTRSDNPGPASAHRVPQTFDTRPSRPLQPFPGTLLDYPDELMIDWGGVPEGSVAAIYWPQVAASAVLELANSVYSSHLLSAADPNTIRCVVSKGVTYVPIPPGTGQNYAGLLTVDLPTSVVVGQEFNVVVRRIATRRSRFAGLPPVNTGFNTEVAPVLLAAANSVAAQGGTRNWRYVVGTFQVKIPVATRTTMLIPEESTLAILKWRLQQMPPTDRWYAVTARYIEYVAGRVDGLGGHSASIPPSPLGFPPKGDHDHDDDDDEDDEDEKTSFDVDGPSGKGDVGLKINVRAANGGPFVGIVDIDCKHQSLSDHRVVQKVDASHTLAIAGLKRTPQGLYQITVIPDATFRPVSQFVIVPASGFVTTEFKMT